MLLQTYHYLKPLASYFKQAASAKTVLTAFGVVVIIGYVTERKKRSIARRKLLSMKKVPLPAGTLRQVQSRAKSASPLAPVSTSIRRRQHSKSPEVDYEISIRLAIEKARAALSITDLKEVLPDELYNFIAEHHPKGQPSSKFLAAVTPDLSEYRDYDWKLYLQNRRSRQRYRSFNDVGASCAGFSRRKSTSTTQSEERAERYDLANHFQPAGAQVVAPIQAAMHLAPPIGQACFRRTSPRQALSSEAARPPRVTIPSMSDNLSLIENAVSSSSKSSPIRRLKRTAAMADLRKPGSQNISSVFPFSNGALHIGDSDASHKLRTELRGTEDNEVVCTIGHPNEFQIQQWHLVSRKTLPFDKLFDNPQLAGHFLPANYHTTYNAVSYILTERQNRSLTDAQVIQALMALGSDLGVYECSRGREIADVEYMRPYNPRYEWGRVERQYWTAREAWKEQSSRDLGVWMMGDGRYVTNYDLHINCMGWEPYRSGAEKNTE